MTPQPDQSDKQFPFPNQRHGDLTEDAWLYRIPMWGRRLHAICLFLLVVVACAGAFASGFVMMYLLGKLGVEHAEVALVLPGVMLVAFAIMWGKGRVDAVFRWWLDRGPKGEVRE